MKKFVLSRNSAKHTQKEYKIPYSECLNKAQWEAVMHDSGHCLVIAGAGTGKTRTLVYRVARLIEDGVKPSNVLLLTFTRRAAREMLDRSANLLDDRCKAVRGGTFHHYCNHILHKYASHIGFPDNFTLIDQADSLETIQHLRTPFVKKNTLKRFPHKGTLQAIISTAVNKQQSRYEVLSKEFSHVIDHHEAIDELAVSYARYKEDQGIMDFDDLLFYTRTLLRQPDIRDLIAKDNRFVMVDEYQDTNNLQAEIAFLISTYHGNLMAVGDDAQSIYAFRGADCQNIFHFPEKTEGACRVISLEENYRSTQQILDLSNELMKTASKKYDKKLFSKGKRGDLPGLVKAPDERDQSRFVSQMILELREQGVPLHDTAVLFRSGRDSYDLEWELNKMAIPFKKFGGLKFSEAAHIKDLLAHIRVVINPEDQIAWNRVLQLLDGLGPKTASELISWLKCNKEENLEEASVVSDSFKQEIKQLSTLLVQVKELRQQPSKAIDRLVTYYGPICEKKFDDYPKRLKDLQAFISLSTNFKDIEEVLQNLVLDPLDASVMDTEKTSNDESPLTLSTIHSAKGLEWNTVFIIQCLDGLIPSGYSLDNKKAMDEELRLLYVACTRAQERLYITYPLTKESSYGDYFSKPSRFLDPITEKLLEPWHLIEAEKPALPEIKETN